MNIEAWTFDELYYKVLKHLAGGRTRSVYIGRTAGETYEERGAVLTLYQPAANILTFDARGLNYAFSVAEWLWMVTGRTDVATVKYFNKNMAGFSDDGLTFRGAYGPAIAQQLPWIIDTLAADETSRQAVMTIWNPRPGPTKDTPCTVMFQFFVRNDALEMIAYMRSNDVWLGLPYDLFNFTQIQRQVQFALSHRLGRELSTGPYTHMAGSLHLYEKNFTAATDLLAGGMAGYDVLEGAPRTPPPEWPVPLEVQSALNDTAQGILPKARFVDAWTPYTNLLGYYVTRKEAWYEAMIGHCPQPWQDLYRRRDNAKS